MVLSEHVAFRRQIKVSSTINVHAKRSILEIVDFIGREQSVIVDGPLSGEGHHAARNKLLSMYRYMEICFKDQV
jgi:hypothetical protein